MQHKRRVRLEAFIVGAARILDVYFLQINTMAIFPIGEQLKVFCAPNANKRGAWVASSQRALFLNRWQTALKAFRSSSYENRIVGGKRMLSHIGPFVVAAVVGVIDLREIGCDRFLQMSGVLAGCAQLDSRQCLRYQVAVHNAILVHVDCKAQNARGARIDLRREEGGVEITDVWRMRIIDNLKLAGSSRSPPTHKPCRQSNCRLNPRRR